ncbi:bromodomain-containing protein 4-like, partial [Salmo salar]|uniref:Bromodomain-containing protein 4-like n=1 Tax=Salmo salar TaxID=8030 RepID=A0ABM3ECP9_SALSA
AVTTRTLWSSRGGACPGGHSPSPGATFASTPPADSPQAPPTQQATPSAAAERHGPAEGAGETPRAGKEEERMADTIDINFQSDLMVIFEENLF